MQKSYFRGMIQASELRVGNWMNHNGRNLQVQTIETLGDGSFAGVLSIGDDYYYRMVYATDGVLKPIQITAEILDASGFNREYPCDEDFERCDFFGKLRLDENGVRLLDYEWGDVLNEPIQYVHELQNLYFMIARKEIEINIPNPA